ncbi:unnamed protein product [Cuscuta campestris]|uniref:Uncharacterized protein n=1 Tax=Cuscuta campestris TaxID=132261 RepID=A0A484N6A7_9ASTE|nr:unnamed protein product [Cuscuta campestris]
MMSAVRKLIVAPLSPPTLAPQAGEVIVQIVEDTTGYTGSVVENSSAEPCVEDDRKSGSDVMDTSACASARVVESTYESECLPEQCPDGVPLIVTDHAPTNGVNGDNHWRSLSILKKVSPGNNVIFSGCTKEFETRAIEVIVFCGSKCFAQEDIVFQPLVTWSSFLHTDGALDPTHSFGAPRIKVFDPGGWSMNGVIFSRSLFDFQLEDKLVFKTGRVIRVYI